MCPSTVAAKGESEPERKETRCKVDEDRKHEYPFSVYCLSLFYQLKRTGFLPYLYNIHLLFM